MRRLIAILLFAAFCLPLALPAFALAQSAESSLPACCRRGGAHHCAMSMAERSQLYGRTDTKVERFHAPMDRCPFCATQAPSLQVVTRTAAITPIVSDAFFSHPTGTAQTESRRRIARDRSRQKRGPPAALLA